jgi:hypothetical protein
MRVCKGAGLQGCRKQVRCTVRIVDYNSSKPCYNKGTIRMGAFSFIMTTMISRRIIKNG